MSFVPNAADGLYAAVIAGLFGLLTWWLNRRSERPARRDAWHTQAEKLRNELRLAYEAQIQFLQGRLSAADAEMERKDTAHDREIARKDAEILRLNKLLNRRGGND